MVICPIIVHFSTKRARSMYGVAWRGMCICVRSKDAQKQLARTSLRENELYFAAELNLREISSSGQTIATFQRNIS